MKRQFEKMMKLLEEEYLTGGLADDKSVQDIASRHNVDVKLIEDQIKMGLKVEREHSTNEKIAEEIAKDHLWEDPHYYDKLDKMEKTFPKIN